MSELPPISLPELALIAAEEKDAAFREEWRFGMLAAVIRRCHGWDEADPKDYMLSEMGKEEIIGDEEDYIRDRKAYLAARNQQE